MSVEMSSLDGLGKNLKKTAESFKAGAREFGEDVSGGVSQVADDGKRMKAFSETGRDLFVTGAVTSHGGNISASDGVDIWITRRNSMLGHIGTGDIIQAGWEVSGLDESASRELIVHRAMYHGYQQRGNLTCGEFSAAIVHAHTRHTIFRSLISDGIVPIDSEGLYTLGDAPIKVYCPKVTVESSEAANMLGQAVFYGADIAIIRGHGPFAIAASVQEAYRLISVLEASAEILDLRDSVKPKKKDDTLHQA